MSPWQLEHRVRLRGRNWVAKALKMFPETPETPWYAVSWVCDCHLDTVWRRYSLERTSHISPADNSGREIHETVESLQATHPMLIPVACGNEDDLLNMIFGDESASGGS